MPTAMPAPLHVNGARLNGWLAKFDSIGRTPTGINRVAYSDADLAGRTFTLGLFREAGFTPRIDAGERLIDPASAFDPIGSPRSR